MRLRLLPAGIVGLSLAVATVFELQACSSFDEASSPTDAAEDGASDAGVLDAPAADTDADGGTSAFCAAQAGASFCEDFETPPVDVGWKGEYLIEGSIELTEGAPASPLHAALTRTPPAVGPAPDAGQVVGPDGGLMSLQTAFLVHNFSPASTSGVIAYEADMRIDDLPPAGDSAMLSAFAVTETRSDGEAEPTVLVVFGRDGATNGIDVGFAVDTGNNSIFQGFTLAHNLHEWFHVAIVVDRAASFASIAIDSMEVKRLQPTPIFSGAELLRLSAGIVTARSPSNTAIAFDNVVLRAP